MSKILSALLSQPKKKEGFEIELWNSKNHSNMTQIMKVMSGDPTDLRLVMLTLLMVRLVEPSHTMEIQKIRRLMFMDTMVISEILVLLDHCLHSTVQLR